MALHDVLAVILGGGRGERLYPLTRERAKPAVPIAGRYRLIDIPISNCLNSGLENIYIVTQYNSVSLHRHITQTYKFDLFSSGWVQILAAEQTPRSDDWYQGTADALRKQMTEVLTTRARDVVILAGDHLYRMDYAAFVNTHRQSGADITVGVKPVTAAEASRLGILVFDQSHRIVTFREKPPAGTLAGLESGTDAERPYMASMGIYVFRIEALVELLERGGQDFGRDVLPAALGSHRVIAYPFDGYWVDIGTIRSFYETNIALARPDPPFDFYDVARPIYTHPRFLPGSRMACDGHFENAMVCEGCLFQDGVSVKDSIVGLRSLVGSGVRMLRSVLMGADYYETPDELATNRREGRPAIGIGDDCLIEGAIIDKNARIGRNVVIRPHREDERVDTPAYVIRDGIVIVVKGATIPDGTII